MIPSSTLLIESVQKWEGVAVLPEETKAKVGVIVYNKDLSGYIYIF